MLSILLQMLGGAVGLPTSAAAAASAAAVAVAAHKQFHPNSPPMDLDSWKEAFLQQASNANGNNARKEVSFMKDVSLYNYVIQNCPHMYVHNTHVSKEKVEHLNMNRIMPNW